MAAPSATQAEHSGFVVLTRGAEQRRIPYWFRVAAPALAAAQATPLAETGTYSGDTRGHPALVDTYRYPEDPRELGVPRTLLGPEQVFRVSIRYPVANFGAAVIGGSSLVQPRVVRAGDENRLLGELALPYNANPYLPGYGFRRASPARLCLEPATTTSSSTAPRCRERAPSPSGSGSATRRRRASGSSPLEEGSCGSRPGTRARASIPRQRASSSTAGGALHALDAERGLVLGR